MQNAVTGHYYTGKNEATLLAAGYDEGDLFVTFKQAIKMDGISGKALKGIKKAASLVRYSKTEKEQEEKITSKLVNSLSGIAPELGSMLAHNLNIPGPSAPPPSTATAPTPTTAVSVPTTPTAPAYTGAQVGGAVPTMTAAQGTVTAPAVAQTGAVTSEATVKGQLEALQQEVTTATQQGTALPVWARGAAEATRAAMQARGMGASSMMAEALS